MSAAVSLRTTSAFPLSVGTSLALESVFEGGGTPIDPDRVIPQKVNIGDYNEFWINLSTLFRNMYNAVEKQQLSTVKSNDFAEAIMQEMEIIEALVLGQSNKLCRVVFYVCNHKGIKSKYPRAKLRGLSTDSQLLFKAHHDKAIQEVINRFGGFKTDRTIEIFDCDLKPSNLALGNPKILIMTHVAHDLLSHNRFNKMDLLESHTGVLKPKRLWYTKYYNGKELAVIPFNKILLPILGDNETFSPVSSSLRKQILEIAESKQWSFVTTEPKVINDLHQLRDPYARTLIFGTAK